MSRFSSSPFTGVSSRRPDASTDDGSPRRFRRSSILALTVAVAVVAAAFTGAAPAMADTVPAEPTTPSTVSNDALPTVQINGVAWSQVVVGNTVYVGGSFTTARPYGAAEGVNTVTRNNLLAYDIRTGELITSFAPSLDAQVRTIAASPDGSRIYIGGDFTSIDGASAWRVAAFSTATGQRINTFKPVFGSTVRALTATNSTVYVGGYFNSANGVSRSRAAALSASNATLLPWAPATDNYVAALQVSPNGGQVVLGGAFTTLNGSSNPGYGLGSVDAVSGALITPFAVNDSVRNGGNVAAIYSLSSDGENLYGTGFHFGGGGNLEGSFSARWSDGSMNWVADCHGDTYDSYPLGGVLYTVSHAHYCGNIGAFPQTDPWGMHYALAFSKEAKGVNTGDIYGYPDHPGQPAPKLEHWFPTFLSGKYTGQGQAGWDVTGNDKYVVVGGEFIAINGVLQQGLTRFAVKSIAPNLDKPRLAGSTYQIKATALGTGSVRVSWPANWDRDNENLTYSLIRNGAAASPINVQTKKSNFWTLPGMTFTDKGLTPGQTYNYRVRVADPFGNFVDSATASVAVSNTPTDPYSEEVLADGASSYWTFNETSGNSAADWAGSNDLALGTGITRGQSGALIGSGSVAAGFSGTSAGSATTPSATTAPDTFTAEAWVKTSTTSGGKILGFGNSSTGDSSGYDRHVYMDNDGKIWFGVHPGGVRTVNSTASFNDGQWHHVAASLGSNGMRLYVDGKLVGSRNDVASGQGYSGYWRVGGDNLGGWTNQPASNYLAGTIDDVAIYPTVLDRAALVKHYVASGRTSPIAAAPADGYGAAVFALDPLLYWRLNDSSGNAAADAGANENPGVYNGDVTKGTTGALAGNANSAASFTGGWTESGVSSASTFNNPSNYTLEAWFKTTTTNGGKIIGFGSSPTGTSGSYDRHVYMENNGTLTFGTYTGQLNTVTSTTSMNDGAWHQVVASQSSQGMKLYVDGQLVGTNPQTSAQDYSGYWRVGGDTTWGGTAPYFAGSIDEVAVYNGALSAHQIAQHWTIGAGVVPNVAPTAAFAATPTDLAVAFDGTASSDSDGTIANYAWDFGDGQTGTGATTSHMYAAPGSYTATLTVTDDDGATAAIQHPVTVVAANVPPTSAYSMSANGLVLAVDGSSSTDSDGTLASYAWSFGDGGTATGVSASHSFASAGSYEVTLVVTDDRGASASVTQTAVVTAPAVLPPTAAFVSTVAALQASFDGSTSIDPDGAIVGFAWNFGDGTTGVGSTVQHSYAASGSYIVTLTATDNQGASGSVSHVVTVTAPAAPAVFGQDRFERTVAAGFGSAETGGAWSLAGGNAAFAVGSGAATIVNPAAQTRRAVLGAATAVDSEVAATFSFTTVTGSGTYASLLARRIGTDDYRARVWVKPTGVTVIQLMRGGTILQQYAVPGLTTNAGDKLSLRLQAVGTNPTTLNARVWKIGATEPTTWQVTSTDTTAALQVAGAVGIETYLGGTATTSVSTVIDDFIARAPVAGPLTPPVAVNQAPTATFAQSATGLTLNVDGSASTDAEGAIAGYLWEFGDGTTATGVTASHSYAAAGAYTVKLTVTDAQGLAGAISKTATVAVPVNVPPTAAFTPVATALGLNVDGSASADPDGSIASYSWAFGDGGTATGATASHLYAAGGTYTVTLTVTDNTGATAATAQSVVVATAPVDPPVDPPVAPPTATDTFERTLPTGWGSADVGGAWTVSGGAAGYAVANGNGQMITPAAVTRRAVLSTVQSVDTDTSVTFAFSGNITGTGVYASVIGRRVAADDYRARIWVKPTGAVVLQVMRTGTILQQVAVAGLSYAPGDTIAVRLAVTGSNPTTITAKAWKVGATEPAAWQLSTTDVTAAMQAAGSIGIESYLGGSSTEAVTVLVDSLSSRKP